MSTLGLWGVVRNGINDGYGYAGYKMVTTLKDLGVEVLWQDEDAPVALSFIQPEEYGGLKKQYRIGYTPWESTELREGWPKIINSFCDEFWTTSYFCKEVFEAGGVKVPIRVVHHGLDSNDWSITQRSRPLGDEPFIFMHQGEPADRKGSQLVFDAFRKVFSGQPNVYLVFKSSASWVECRWFDDKKSIIGPVDDYPNVQIIRGVLKQDELDELYRKVHCLVYPTNGEGFGLIPFQAAASGMPALAPIWGGLKDFGEYLLPIDYKVGPSNHGYHLGEWALPDFDSVCDQMKYVYDNYDELAKNQYSLGLDLREKFKWEDIFSPIVDDLSQVLKG